MNEYDRPLRYDAQIRVAAANGDNDLAQEMSVAQREYYDHFCSDPRSLAEWRRRNVEWAERSAEAAQRLVDPTHARYPFHSF